MGRAAKLTTANESVEGASEEGYTPGFRAIRGFAGVSMTHETAARLCV